MQDSDLSQNNVKSRTAWDKIEARKFTIPARSPDLNRIKNIFHIVKRKLHHDVLQLAITWGDFESFSTDVKRTLEVVQVDVVNRTIRSVNNRIECIVTQKRAENQILKF